MAAILLMTAESALPATTAKKKVAAHPLPKGKRSVRSRKGRTPAPSYQLHPDSARYAEIQRALADRGYYKGETNGEWKDDSTDALRHFQTDQKLTDDGKISALTLSALGLGPQHGSAVPPTPPL